MVLTANVAGVTKIAPGLQEPEIQTTEEIYSGAYLGAGSRDDATAADRGRMFAFNDEASVIPLGFSVSRETGDTGAAPIVRGRVATEAAIVDVAVTGLAGTEDDTYRLVYATDDNVFDLARPTVGIPLGWVWRHNTSSRALVEFFSSRELAILAMGGSAQETWFLGVVSGGIGTGNALTGIECSNHGRILSVYGIVIEPQVDADADLDYNLEIGGTNVTGGVIEFVTADAVGAKKAGTAITAANVFHEGDLIDVEVVENTAGTAVDGYMGIYAMILREPGT